MAFKLRKPPKLTAKLEAYPYQLDAVRAVRPLPYAAIFHEQGLGKTKIAVDLILYWLENDIVDTAFIVTKKILVQNWIDELSTHSYVTPKILSENRRKNSIALNSPVLIYVMNYEVISANIDLIHLFLSTCRVGVILDESQKIKNPKAKLSIDFHSLSTHFSRRIIMTGTPVANRPQDLWSQIKFLDCGKSLGDSFAKFKNSVDLPDKTENIHPYGEKLSETMERLKEFSVRETKKTAGIALPNKTILTHFVELEPNQANIYASYRNDLIYEFKSDKGIIKDNAEDVLKRLLRLVQCASNPMLVDETYKGLPSKFVRLEKLIQEINIQTNKVIVWTCFVENIEWLSNKLQSLLPAKVHGKISIEKRYDAIRRFKTQPSCKILLATPGAAKEGLTLTIAKHAVFYDRGFSLDDYLQAQDRIHRIPQKESCFVHNLIAKETIDEWVDILLNAKHQAAQLAQGDISQNEFKKEFNFDLSEALKQILQYKNYQFT